jgi:hypothetical protein
MNFKNKKITFTRTISFKVPNVCINVYKKLRRDW